MSKHVIKAGVMFTSEKHHKINVYMIKIMFAITKYKHNLIDTTYVPKTKIHKETAMNIFKNMISSEFDDTDFEISDLIKRHDDVSSGLTLVTRMYFTFKAKPTSTYKKEYLDFIQCEDFISAMDKYDDRSFDTVREYKDACIDQQKECIVLLKKYKLLD